MSLLLMRGSPLRQILSTSGLVACYLPYMDMSNSVLSADGGRLVNELASYGDFETDTDSDGSADGITMNSAAGSGVFSLSTDAVSGSKSQKYTASVGGGSPRIYFRPTRNLTDKYLYMGHMKADKPNGIFRFSHGMGRTNITSIPTAWGAVGIILTNSGNTAVNASYYQSIDYDYVAEGDSVYWDGWMQVNLTQAFGAGNEPTLVWCLANIEYFNSPGVMSQSVVDRSGHGNHAQLGSTPGGDTNDPTWSHVSLYFDGVDDAVANEPVAEYALYAWGANNTALGWVSEIPATAGYWFGGIRMSRTPGTSEEARLKSNIATILAGQGVSLA